METPCSFSLRHLLPWFWWDRVMVISDKRLSRGKVDISWLGVLDSPLQSIYPNPDFDSDHVSWQRTFSTIVQESVKKTWQISNQNASKVYSTWEWEFHWKNFNHPDTISLIQVSDSFSKKTFEKDERLMKMRGTRNAILWDFFWRSIVLQRCLSN